MCEKMEDMERSSFLPGNIWNPREAAWVWVAVPGLFVSM